MDLEVSFREKTTKRFGSDDSPFLLSRSDSGTGTLFEGFYLIGSLPWEYTQSPHILYSYPAEDKSAQVYIPFLLPDGCKYQTRSFETVGDMIQDVYHSPYCENGHTFALYFPENKRTPYLFVHRFTVTPLTLPSFAHDLSLGSLLKHVTHTAVPTCDVCLAMKTRFPCLDLFRKFVRWLFDTENVARMTDFATIDRYLFNYCPLDDGDFGSWPELHRQVFRKEIMTSLASVFPCPGNEVHIDIVPFPEFRWVVPNHEESKDEIAREVLFDLVKRVTVRMFMKIMKALVLEKTIIVYHKEECVVTNVILALHFLLQPMKWVCGSVSVLPPQFEDLLNAPNPFLIGSLYPMQQVTNGYVYVELEQRYVQWDDDEFRYPKEIEMERAVKELFRKIHDKESHHLLDLLHLCNDSVKRMIDPVSNSIIADVSDADLIQSKFFVELFLKQFVYDERPFLEAFCETQMFQLYIEQECKKRSISVLADCTKSSVLQTPVVAETEHA